MTDLAEAPTEPLSTTIDNEPGTISSGGGVPKLTEPAPEPSLRDTIADEVRKENEARDKPDDGEKASVKEKAEPKPEAEAEKPKAARGEDGKFAAAAKLEVPDKPAPETRQAEPDKAETRHTEPPKNFLPDSKEMWRNVPRPVRRDIEIMVREHEGQIERSRVASERYEGLRQFDELARSNGRDLRDSLARINEVENLMQRNPIAGLDAILREIGPRKSDGGSLSLYDLAQHIVGQGPQAYHSAMAQEQQRQPQIDPRMQEMEQRVLEAEMRALTASVIEPFKAENPRYDELSETIASVLNSDMIPRSLSHAERLEAAYVIAERINPPSSRPADEDSGPAPERRAADSLNGSKSIRSAPGAVSSDLEPERGGSIRDTLLDEMRRAKRS